MRNELKKEIRRSHLFKQIMDALAYMNKEQYFYKVNTNVASRQSILRPVFASFTDSLTTYHCVNVTNFCKVIIAIQTARSLLLLS